MNRLFLVALAGNWLANPLGIILAQNFSLANTPQVIIVLLSASVCAPFQLYLNESVAIDAAKNGGVVNRRRVIQIISIQCLVVLIYLNFFNGLVFGGAIYLIICAFLLISNFLSYRSTLLFYRRVLAGRAMNHQALIVGALPGMISLSVYVAYILSVKTFGQQASYVIFFTIVIPAVIQWWYVKKLCGENEDIVKNDLVPFKKKHGSSEDLLFLCSLSVASLLGTVLRENISEHAYGYVGVAVVFLNAISTIIVTITRKKYFAQKSPGGKSYRTLLFLIVLSVLGVMFFYVGNLISQLLALICLQAFIAIVLNLSRQQIARA